MKIFKIVRKFKKNYCIISEKGGVIVLSNGENFYKQYVNGDDCAFEHVLAYYYEGLVYFISRYTHSVFDAEEIANDCFLYIAIHKNKYNFKTSLKTYLYTIGRSKAINFLRKNKKYLLNDNIENHLDLTKSEDFQKTLENKETKAIILNAISSLPKDMQNAVYLFYYEEMSYKQIANVLKKSSKQIDNILFRAKKILKEKLLKEVDILE